MASDLIHLMRSLFLPVAQAAPDAAWQPPTDVYRTHYGWLVKFDLAGVRPEDVELSVSGSRLTISDTRRDWCREEGYTYYLMEITYSHFQRTIALPADLEHARVSTEHRHGLLLVRFHTEADD